MQHCEDVFFQKLIEQQMPVTVFLIGGVKLQGHVTHQDVQSFVLRREGQSQLIFKNAVATVMPGKSFSL